MVPDAAQRFWRSQWRARIRRSHAALSWQIRAWLTVSLRLAIHDLNHSTTFQLEVFHLT